MEKISNGFPQGTVLAPPFYDLAIVYQLSYSQKDSE